MVLSLIMLVGTVSYDAYADNIMTEANVGKEVDNRDKTNHSKNEEIKEDSSTTTESTETTEENDCKNGIDSTAVTSTYKTELDIITDNDSVLNTRVGKSKDNKYLYEMKLHPDDNQYTIDVKIKNITKETIKDWYIKFYSENYVERIDGAYIYSETADNHYVVSNEEWNDSWLSGQEFTFTLTLNTEEKINYLNDFTLVLNYSGVEDDEAVSLGDDMVLSADDIDDENGISQETKELLKKYPDFQTQEEIVEDIIPQSTSTTEKAKLEYTIDLNGTKFLKKSGQDKGGTYVIQNFYVGSTYIYVTQQNQGKVVVSRCTKNGSKATYKDCMTIEDAGHGQTLDLYEYNGKTYFLFALGKKTANANWTWSTQIGRIQYKAGATINGITVPRFNYLAYANKNNSNFGATKRADAAVSTDKTRLLIWKRRDDNKCECSIFSLSAFNKQLDKASSSNKYCVSFKGNSSMKNNCISSFNNVSTDRKFYKYCQGVELSNKGSNSLHSIYWSMGDNCRNRALTIGRWNSAGEYKKSVNINHNNISTSNMELEGLSIPQSGNNIRFVLVKCTGTKKLNIFVQSRKVVFSNDV